MNRSNPSPVFVRMGAALELGKYHCPKYSKPDKDRKDRQLSFSSTLAHSEKGPCDQGSQSQEEREQRDGGSRVSIRVCNKKVFSYRAKLLANYACLSDGLP